MQYEQISDVFDAAQRAKQSHSKLVTALKKLQSGNMNEDKFREDFIHYLKYGMIIFKRESSVERFMDFVAQFATFVDKTESTDQESESMDEFLQFLFIFLLDHHEDSDKAVRFRVCQLINKLLSCMDEEASIDEDLADRIFDAMLIRVYDKVPVVRVQAILAVSRLQDPSDEECPIIAAYLNLLSTDNSVDVRQAVLNSIALSTQTLPQIIGRTCDIKESIRKTAYLVLGKKVSIRALSITQRVQLLDTGLKDRDSSVRKVCIEYLLKAWIKFFDGNLVELLQCLDVEFSADTMEMSLQSILKVCDKEGLLEHIAALRKFGQCDDEGPISVEYSKLTSEVALFWRCLGQHFHSMGENGVECMDMLVPDLSTFCQYILRYYKDNFSEPTEDDSVLLQKTFILKQLVMLLGYFDLSDTFGRKQLGQLVHDLLMSTNIPLDLIETLHARYMDVETDHDKLINELVEIISEIRQPMMVMEKSLSEEEQRDKDIKLASMKVKIMELKDQMEESIQKHDFIKAEDIKQSLAAVENDKRMLEEEESMSQSTENVGIEKDDAETLLKCLTIACEMLTFTNRKGLNPSLTTLVETLILTGVQNEDPLVRNVAIRCLGLCSLLSKEFAVRHLILFLQVSQMDQDTVRVTAIQAIFDLLLMYGMEAFKFETPKNISEPASEENQTNTSTESAESEVTQTNLEEKIDEASETENRENLEAAAVQNLLNILISFLDNECVDIRTAAGVGLAKLMVNGRVMSAKLFSRLLLLWYNPTTEDDTSLRQCLGIFMPMFAFNLRGSQELIEEAFLPTLKTLFNAPNTSPLAAVNDGNVAELLVHLTCSRHTEYYNNSGTQPNSSQQGGGVHDSIAVKISNEILSEPDGVGVRVLCRILTFLELSKSDQSNIKDLQVLTTRMLDEVGDRMSVKYLNKFHKMLMTLDESSEESKLPEEVTSPTSTVQENDSDWCEETESPDNDENVPPQTQETQGDTTFKTPAKPPLKTPGGKPSKTPASKPTKTPAKSTSKTPGKTTTKTPGQPPKALETATKTPAQHKTPAQLKTPATERNQSELRRSTRKRQKDDA